MLSLLTLTTHGLLFLFIVLHIPASSAAPSSVIYWFSVYNLFATAASLVGVVGTIWANPNLIFIYVAVHSTTLLIITLTLLNLFLPIPIVGPFIARWQSDERNIYRELGGYRSEEECIARCDARFAILKVGVGCVVGVALAIQWWVLGGIWTWGMGLLKDGMGERWANFEEDGLMDSNRKVKGDFDVLE
ncbi:hypothetical protein K505DRAFT_10747 [Melanomma pulvis-pyrius CBS 109.77]|uniref:MARVEL domain-containing protein n=1 Tax=Melanomma pulvis-pyrius CBS 109.77 TaxID=1314802 RepID=A0A6A6XI56_9PLEO|nr:hypothetical protein K505DRAFT_10747 [Melanomma pulvis-pyrius CBS 109.77]